MIQVLHQIYRIDTWLQECRTQRTLAYSWLRKITKALMSALHETQGRATPDVYVGMCLAADRQRRFGAAVKTERRYMNENLSRIFPKCLHSFSGAVHARSVVQPRLRIE